MTYTLEKADSKIFAQWWAVYRPNEDFSQTYAEQYADIVDVPFCHWLLTDGERVGGLIHVNNQIGDMFTIPPFDNLANALSAVLPEGRMIASAILSEHVPALESLGFTVVESRHWMIRPTQTYDVSFDFRRASPQPEQTQSIAELMYRAFQGGVGEYGRRDLDGFINSVTNYFEHITLGDNCHQASSVLWDGEQMIAVCLMQPHKSHVTVRFVVTHPDYRKCGIARRLMEYGINTVKDDYATVSLAVTIGNPAEQLYTKMGFASAPATHTLIRDTK